jgi:hypothetical protein
MDEIIKHSYYKFNESLLKHFIMLQSNAKKVDKNSFL